MENTVFLKSCEDYSELNISTAIDEIFQHFGGVETILSRGRDILIKPNLLMARAPETATTAHPEIVYAVAKRLVDAGANVVIADSPGGPYTPQTIKKVYEQCGMDRAAQRLEHHIQTFISNFHKSDPHKLYNPMKLSVIFAIFVEKWGGMRYTGTAGFGIVSKL